MENKELHPVPRLKPAEATFVLKQFAKLRTRFHRECLKMHDGELDTMIRLLEEAIISNLTTRTTVQKNDPINDYPLALDLLEEGCIRGTAGTDINKIDFVSLDGIRLKGRELLDKLRGERHRKSFAYKLEKIGYFILGGLCTGAAIIFTELCVWFFKN